MLKILPFGTARAKTRTTQTARPRRNGATQPHPSQQLGAEGWLTVHHVKKSYRKRLVVRGVSLAVGRG